VLPALTLFLGQGIFRRLRQWGSHCAITFADFDVARLTSTCFERDASLGGAQLLAWVLMPDHAHWLLQLGERESLEKVVNRMKAGSARSTNADRARSGPLCSRAYHDHAMRHDEDARAAARYIIANPLRAGLAKRVGDYPFGNASWL